MNVQTDLPRIFGVVPAAGHSRRMGSAKQLLQVHGRPMLEGITATLAAGPLAAVAVVTHPKIHKQLHLERVPGVFVVINDADETQMIDSIRMGLNALAEREEIRLDDGFMICPGDKPGVTTEDVEACVKAFQARPECIVVAAHHGRRGHPMIFPSALMHAVHSDMCDGGLNQLLNNHGGCIWEIPRHREILEDIDTPADYLRLAR